MARIPEPPGVDQQLVVADPSGFLGETRQLTREFQKLGITLGELGKDIQAVQDARRDAQRKMEFTRESASMSRELRGFATEIERRPEFMEDLTDFESGAEQRLADRLANIEDPIVRDQVEITSRRMIEALRSSVDSTSFAKQKDQGRAGVAQSVTDLVSAFSDARTDEERFELREQAHVSIRLSDFFSEQEKVKMSAAFDKEADRERMRKLLNEERFAEVEFLLENAEDALPGFDAQDISQFRTALRVGMNQSETANRAARAERERVAFEELLERTYNPDPSTPGRDVPTIPEILDSEASPGVKEKFIKLISEAADGLDPNETNETLTNELWRRVHDPSHPDPITSPSQLVPFLGGGLSREDHDKLTQDIENLSKPDRRRANQLLNDFLKSAESQITKSSLIASDPLGDKKFFAFRQEVDRIWNEAGSDTERLELLDPNSPKFLGKLVPRFKPTLQEMQADLRSQAGGEASGPAIPEATPRNPGESIEEYLRRNGP